MLYVCSYVNPRTRDWVRSKNRVTRNVSIKVSIHAPVIGCEALNAVGILFGMVSIHAPVIGCEPGGMGGNDTDETVSIHAPVIGCEALRLF